MPSHTRHTTHLGVERLRESGVRYPRRRRGRRGGRRVRAREKRLIKLTGYDLAGHLVDARAAAARAAWMAHIDEVISGACHCGSCTDCLLASIAHLLE